MLPGAACLILIKYPSEIFLKWTPHPSASYTEPLEMILLPVFDEIFYYNLKTLVINRRKREERNILQ